jgi:hypothetical protein
MITRTSGSAGPFADRYRYDCGACSAAKGWAQVDTKQDAPYYGTWTNPTTREIFNYCEGDTSYTRCDTDEEYVSEVNTLVEWNRERGYWQGIDPGFDEAMKTRFVALGLGELLH